MKKIIYYSAIVIGIGFLFRMIDGQSIDAFSPQIGQLLWLIAPLVFALLFHFALKQRSNWGLKLRFKQSWKWYLIAIAIFTILFGVLTITGISVGSVDGLKPLWTTAFFTAVLSAAPAQFVKNIFEEFVWRGFLYSQFEKLGLSRLGNHLSVGLIWALWHMPYLDGFASIYHNMSWQLYVPLFVIGAVVTSILYGEIRRRSGTVWTAVILHTTANAFVNTLFIEDYIKLASGREWWIAPVTDNLGYIIVIGAVGWMLYKWKTAR